MRKFPLFVVAAAMAACSPTMINGDDAGADVSDSASDARNDAANDTRTDTGADVRTDTGVPDDVQSQPDASDASDSGSDASDSAMEAGSDASDSGADSAPDSAPDATPDSAVDGGMDAMVDSGADAAADSSPDASADGAAEAGSDSGTVPSRVVWALRMGDGTAALSAAATAGFIERRSFADGTMMGANIALPVAASGAQRECTFAGSSTAEGILTRSADGRYATVGCYAAAPGLASVAGTAAPATLRVVGRIAADGTVDTSTTLDSAFTAGNIRAAATVDGTAFWAAGSNSGVQYTAFGATSTPTQVLAAPTNIRTLGVFAGQLWGTSGSGAFVNAFSIGTGTPTTAGATATSAPGMPTSTASPYNMALFDLDGAVAGVDTLYIADDRAVASGGGVQKWTFNGTTWTLAATISGGLTAGVRGMAAVADGTAISIVAVTTENPSRVIAYVDRPGMTPTMPTVLATAPTNTQYRGVAFAPTM